MVMETMLELVSLLMMSDLNVASTTSAFGLCPLVGTLLWLFKGGFAGRVSS